MRRLRFKLGTLMIVVLLMGGVLGWGVEMRRRSANYRGQMLYHRQEELRCHRDVARIFACGAWVGFTPEENRAILMEFAKPWRERAQYHRRMKEKYGRAAGHPWERVEPDPPEPEAE
ncbi:MAG TPA: hypothetical protein VFF52_15320 [Isosphaeraceae bacterium]|nr:hypothetical protein [Isosphaeraceae bacterium]